MDTDFDLNWKFTQCFGDKGDLNDITEADIISAVEFDHTGVYLATGDRGGRVVLFERNEGKKECEYKFYTEFQSHEPEFDYLKSLEIEEKINKIKWLKRQNAAHFLLSTNDKTIKLWKIYDKAFKVVSECNIPDRRVVPSLKPSDLKLPVVTHHDTITAAVARKIYSNAHAYHINSLSVNSDGETFLSADDLRINLWNLNVSDQCFNIVDIKPINMEDLTEVITAAEFHPINCNSFIYSISKGAIRYADMRCSAYCEKSARVFMEPEDNSSRTFFTEIISSVSDVKFSHDGRYILSRDYMSMKLWDVNMENKPVKTVYIHNHLQSKLCDLYESDYLFDKFECIFSGDSNYALTGSYNNFFQIHSTKTEHPPIHLQADKSAFKAKKVSSNKHKSSAAIRRPMTDFSAQDFQKKILHASWHPKENSIAVAATNNLFIFSTL